MASPKRSARSSPDAKVTPDEIRAKFAELEGSAKSTARAAAPVGLAAGAGALLVLLVLAFLLGKRRGGKRQTVVEIRRI